MVEGEASEWFHWMKTNRLLGSWSNFLDQVKLRFDATLSEDFIGRLSKARQLTTVAAYRAEYEKLLNKVSSVPETVLISMFVAGLKSTLRREVYRAKPHTLIEAFSLASEFEAQQGELQAEFHVNTSKGNQKSHYPPPPITPPPVASSSSTPPIQALHPPKHQSYPLPIKRLSLAERQAKLDKGECFMCDQKWSRNHKCSSQFLFLMGTDDEQADARIFTFDHSDDHTLSGDISSLNSMAGPGTQRSLWLKGELSGMVLNILIDGDSTQNFIRPSVAERSQLRLTEVQPFRVYIGNGDSLRFTYCCKQITLTLQGHQFVVDLYVLPIQGPDVVLGVQWLQELGKVTHDYSKLTMECYWHKKPIFLRGEPSAQPKQIGYNHLQAFFFQIRSP
ncbi:unnamed protein product [Cuscuta europaea]|uniref:Ty3 transposon capsid-like protein domain-containing protein n=1 Tax=Cuscuta europaea TaxID=41803 RepID=A0A9P0YQW2_CUSEU|nr:unnamed protein product [Cuscuta europaea]